ncbi:LysR family transcriptional regulator [Paratractidigestivibacter sp.]|uniref:LysR family transcriptional regulator n=1 Tax=Paratractidigestivibacter sp. TaxID=2847316 RepID=UPI002ABDD0F3|nr:LysR family transcriptional regulator [Paratractidigestivibacter sp.]
MDIRVMRSFITIAQVGSVTGAAEELHVSQPALSRQMIDLERELGRELLDRSGRRITLTADGQLFLSRAREVVGLFDKTSEEFRAGTLVGGDIHIGASETQAMCFIGMAAARLARTHPDVHLHLHSEDSDAVTEHLEHGLYDFGVMVGPARTEVFRTLALPRPDVWGVLVPAEDDLASRDVATPDDLAARPLIVPEKRIAQNRLADWFGQARPELSPRATYNLLFNASLLVREGVGAALCLGGIVAPGSETSLAFVPLSPALTSQVELVWSRSHELAPAGKALLGAVRELVNPTELAAEVRARP